MIFLWKSNLWNSVAEMLVFSHHLKLPDAEFEHRVDLNYIKPYNINHLYEWFAIYFYWYENFPWDNSIWILISNKKSQLSVFLVTCSPSAWTRRSTLYSRPLVRYPISIHMQQLSQNIIPNRPQNDWNSFF